MSLTPYTTTLENGAVAQGAALVDNYDFATRGRGGLIVVHDISAIGVGHSFVTSADITLPVVVVAATNDQFEFNEVEYIVAPGSYATLAALATAVTAATKDEDFGASPAFSTLVLVTADPNGTGLRFTAVPSGVDVLAFGTGAENDVLAALGITDGWTIAHTEAAGADASCSVVIDIQGKDEASGKFYAILTGAAQTTVSTKVLQVHPHMDSVGNLVMAAQLPANVRIVVTRATDDSYTRTLGIQLTAST
jgi:hypothetical protein